MTMRVRFQGRNFDREVVGAFVRSVRELRAARAWEVMDPEEPLVVDVPAVGLGALVLGVREGTAPSMVLSYMMARLSMGAEGRRDRRLTALLVQFVSRATDAREFERVRRSSDLLVGDEEFVAWVTAIDRDEREASFEERHLWLLARCGSALADLCARMPHELGAHRSGDLSEAFTDEDGIELVLTSLSGGEPPRDDVGRVEPGYVERQSSMFDVADLRTPLDEEFGSVSARSERHGRNEPCPCGSGRKYKKCCLAQHQREAAATRGKRDTDVETRDDSGDFDEHMLRLLLRFAQDELRLDWSKIEKLLRTPMMSGTLVVHWALFCHHVDGRSPARHYEERRAAQLSRRERAWLAGRLDGWMSIFEVDTVEPGAAIDFVDLLTGRLVRVRERTASKLVGRRDALLARIVEEDGHFELDGVHERALPPDLAADLVRRAKRRLRRAGDVPVEQLDDPGFTAYLVRRWGEEARNDELRRRVPPRLQNTDGDELVDTRDYFTFAAEAQARVLEQLLALEDARCDEVEDEEVVVSFQMAGNRRHAHWENTVIGRAFVRKDTLLLESNSVERADALKARVLAVLDGTLIGTQRSTTKLADHLTPSQSAASAPMPTQELTSLAGQQIVRDYLEKHYTNWPDMKLPALGDRTPREAMESAAGRVAVENLVKTMEHHDSSRAEWERYDFDRLRKALGLPT